MEMISAKFIQELHRPIPGFGPTTREAVAGHFRARAGGVGPAAAQRQTLSFYRSSGHAWTLALN